MRIKKSASIRRRKASFENCDTLVPCWKIAESMTKQQWGYQCNEMQIWSSCPPREKLQGSHTLRLLPIFIVKLNKLSIATTEPPCGSCEITGMDWGFGAARVKWSKEKAGADQTLAWKLQETCWKAPWEWRGQNGETEPEETRKTKTKAKYKIWKSLSEMFNYLCSGTKEIITRTPEKKRWKMR